MVKVNLHRCPPVPEIMHGEVTDAFLYHENWKVAI
jgi:hypothetical protein